MKRRLLMTLFITCCLGLTLIFPGRDPTFAQVSSEGKVSLKENNRVTEPKEPLDPSKPRPDDTDNLSTNEKGPLSLDVVPKGFYFGTQKMYHAAHTYQATGTEDHLQYLQVTDNRDANVNGWSLKVRQAHYLRDEQTNHELTGATLSLPQGETRNEINPNGSSTSADGLIASSVSINNQELTLFSATDRAKVGKATSTNFWSSRDVTLTIPRDTVQAGNYSTKIYWILTDGGPAN